MVNTTHHCGTCVAQHTGEFPSDWTVMDNKNVCDRCQEGLSIARNAKPFSLGKYKPAKEYNAYLVFFCEHYYPNGPDDFKGSAATLKDAVALGETLLSVDGAVLICHYDGNTLKVITEGQSSVVYWFFYVWVSDRWEGYRVFGEINQDKTHTAYVWTYPEDESRTEQYIRPVRG